MYEVRRWARVIEEHLLPRIQEQLHPSTVAAVLRELCETNRHALPVYTNWLSSPAIDICQVVADHARNPDFIVQQSRVAALMLGSNVTNVQWTAYVLVNLALHDLLPSLVATRPSEV